jgi:hypothetical protein
MRLLQFCSLEPQRIFRREIAGLQLFVVNDIQVEIEEALAPTGQLWIQPPAQIVQRVPALCCYTKRVRRSGRRSPLASRRREVSRLFQQIGSDLLPRDYVARIFRVAFDAAIKFRALLIRQLERVCFQALPHGIEQFGLFAG